MSPMYFNVNDRTFLKCTFHAYFAGHLILASIPLRGDNHFDTIVLDRDAIDNNPLYIRILSVDLSHLLYISCCEGKQYIYAASMHIFSKQSYVEPNPAGM